jgi:hypothetical protein
MNFILRMQHSNNPFEIDTAPCKNDEKVCMALVSNSNDRLVIDHLNLILRLATRRSTAHSFESNILYEF